MSNNQSVSKFGILIRTYHKDSDRLHYCLKSIIKYCEDISEIVVICPVSSSDSILKIVRDFEGVKIILCEDYINDYVGQQITKLKSHTYCESDYIIHVDSDCYFTKTFRPDYYFENGLPILYHREYDYFYRSGIVMPWQSVTSYFLSRQVDFEFMALLPLIYPRQIYIDLERWYLQKYGTDYNSILEKIICPTLFSEFNLIGAFSYYMSSEKKPYHHHINWGLSSPEHYLVQGCLDGSPDRSIQLEELQAIEIALK